MQKYQFYSITREFGGTTPQGSVAEPILFLLYTADILNVASTRTTRRCMASAAHLEFVLFKMTCQLHLRSCGVDEVKSAATQCNQNRSTGALHRVDWISYQASHFSLAPTR